MRMLKQHFIEGVEKIENTTIHGLYDETSAPHIISVGIAGIRREVLLHALATLRFSMSEFTTMEEIDYTLDALYNIVPMLRRYTRH